ncbi:hypothetical protein MNR01_00325 [Lysobacter sp. S4-A87]|uniref:hypothetical protein n=1 Tax=Lysobacter sp. S4-A87 TaxID=2925843 RepID=UPI001F53C15A|nr:hypothetical protein [Lysobacter sp. S4-A87]UNK49530.1 hypothetical protein MNR01_00325 [Lysobacter sp. S4-A87]
MVVIATAVAIVLVAGPALLALTGLVRSQGTQAGPVPVPNVPTLPAWDKALTLSSALLYTLAFNLTFFIQELFLVLPKALTPGLRPTLFHNNHKWDGEHALASLFQGTGALATVIAALACIALLRRARGTQVRLFLIWMACCGLFMALPQVVIGALSSGSDVGMAMDYLQLGTTAKTVAALAALAVMPLAATSLARAMLAIADDPARIATPRARTRFMWQVETLPAIVGTVLVIPFRVPREALEVVLLPVLVAWACVAWMQAGAWRLRDVDARGTGAGSSRYLLLAVVTLLLAFQLLLRPGIEFF